MSRKHPRVFQVSNHPIHPWYGPCDAMGTNDECSECQRVHEQAAVSFAYIQKIVTDLVATIDEDINFVAESEALLRARAYLEGIDPYV